MDADTKCRKPLPLPPLEAVRTAFRYDGRHLHWLIGRRRGKPAGGSNGRYVNLQFDPWGRFYEHRMIWLWWYGEDPGDALIDHRNRDGFDNSIANLRKCDNYGQQQNRIIWAGAQSRFRGVRMIPLKGGQPRWLAGIRPPGQSPLHLGTFDSEHDAAHAYNLAASRLHGEFAVLNTLPDREPLTKS